jgi:hypothetical protein
MATTRDARLAPVTARDGADTRNKDNSGKVATGTEEVTRLGGGDQKRVGQTAALYLVPAGETGYWTNYLRLADAYVNGEDMFQFVSYKTQQSYNEQDIQRECNRIGPNTEGMLNLYRESYNRCITEFRKTLLSNHLENALEYLEDFKKEQREQEDAAKVIQNWFRAFPKISETGTLVAEDEEPEDYGKCVNCDERRIGMFVELCADCYWTEDSWIKSMRRNGIASSQQECGGCHKTDEMAHGTNFCWDCFEAAQEWEDELIDSYERKFDYDY